MKKFMFIPLMLFTLFSLSSFADFGPSYGSYNSFGSYNSYGGMSNFGEVQTMGGSNDNVTCACARKVQSGDQSDPVCNQRVKEMVNVAIQRSQMNGVGGTMNSLMNSGVHGGQGGLLGSPSTLGTP
ncbi:MAG: hypothetical protein KA116_11640 [Proteobacteria bacterium]|nr:hypothetical protein [Pseudomonadota bacterium]